MVRTTPQLIPPRFTAPRHPDSGLAMMSGSGKYVVQLWDLEGEGWEDIVIDDQ